MDIEGGILPSLIEVPKFVRRNSRFASEISSFIRKDIPAYSDVALREVLVNAIAHADYSLTGMRIMISIFSDRLEIQNPGLLPFGMTFESFKAGASVVRNRTVAKVLHQLSLMEEWGSGYHRIVKACEKNGHPLPEWFEIGLSLRVVFKPHATVEGETVGEKSGNVPVNVPVNKRQQWFLDQLKNDIECRPVDIVTKWGVVVKTAKRDIRDLQKKGFVQLVGPAKTGKYRLIPTRDS